MVNVEKTDLDLEIKKDEEFAYGFLIEVITGGLYPNKFHVIREYVQNSFDAISKWRLHPNFDNEGSIKIELRDKSIIIYDTGTGMDRSKTNQYRYVGYSEKKLGEGTGFRGIGKLSGISVAEKLIVTTSQYDTPERYKLIFDAEAMVVEILDLKSRGENIPLNELIKKHTVVSTEEEDKSLHYTIVELYNIRSDSEVLFDEDKLVQFLGLNAPVGFDEVFDFSEEIDQKIKEVVEDYETVSIKVGENEVYKPYISPCKAPQYVLVWDNAEHDEEPNLLAFCWYCQNTENKQFEDKERSGLLFRCKNFTIGDRQLTREKLWPSTPERAFWFFGEVIITDPEVLPTSERSNFKHNDSRNTLYEKGKEIGRTLSRVVGKSSEESRAVIKIDESDKVINQIQAEYNKGKISEDIRVEKVVVVYKAIEEATKRINKAPTDAHKQRAREAIKRGNELIKKLDEKREKKTESKIYDITKELDFDDEIIKVYTIIINTLKDELIDDPQFYEHLIKRIHSELRSKLK